MPTSNESVDDEVTFDFRHYLGILRRYLALLIIIPILGVVAAGVVTRLTPSVYEAQVSLLLRPAQPIASTDPTVAQLNSDQIASTYAALMTQPPLLSQVVSELHLNVTPVELGRSITVGVDPNTTILTVAADARSPSQSATIANRLVADFITRMRGIQQSESTAKTGPPKDDFVIVSPATAPTGPIGPSLKRNAAVGLVGGLALALVIVAVLSLLDQSIKRDEDLLRRTGLIAIAHVPAVAGVRRPLGELVALRSDSPAAEAYRVLRTNLIFSSVDRAVRTIVVTSPRPGEGKSRTAANLAVSLSQSGHRTLLVDCDLRRPSQHLMFSHVRNFGLTNLILEDVPEEHLLWTDAQIPNLWVLGSGPIPPNPAELIGSARMRAVLQRLSEAYDFMVVDSPPVEAVTDPCILGAQLDGCLLVVQHGGTRYADVIRSRTQLERVGGHVLGVVLNKIRGQEASDYAYGYSAYRGRSQDPAVDRRPAHAERASRSPEGDRPSDLRDRSADSGW